MFLIALTGKDWQTDRAATESGQANSEAQLTPESLTAGTILMKEKTNVPSMYR